MANIVQFNTFLIQVEIKKKCYWKCWLSLSNELNQQIKLHPTRWHYPLIIYLTEDKKKSEINWPVCDVGL